LGVEAKVAYAETYMEPPGRPFLGFSFTEDLMVDSNSTVMDDF